MFNFNRPLGFGAEFSELGVRVLTGIRAENWFGDREAELIITQRDREGLRF